MRVLLDTSYLYRLLEARGEFTQAERRFLDENEARLHASAVSIWEMRLKYHARHPSGARKSPHDPDDAVAMLQELDVTLIAMTPGHAAAVLAHPLDHRDPFDELLLAQAQEEGLRLLTVDRCLAGHPLAVTA